jgi:two-component system, NarL family, nitrate/nitrite response regulator NarL
MEAITRVVVSAHVRLYREGIELLLEREPDIEVVATAATKGEALASVAAFRPDVVVFDSAMPDGVASMRAIQDLAAGIKLVALGLPELDRAIIVCAEAGVSGYVFCGGSRAELVATIRSTARGEALCSPRVTASLLRRVAAVAASPSERAVASPPGSCRLSA